MARSAPILNRDTSHLLFTFKPPHSPFHSLTSLRLTKPTLLPTLLSSSSSPGSCITRVTTVPVEYAPPAPEFEFDSELARLKSLRSRLAGAKSLRAKTRVIDGDSRVKRFFNSGNNRVFSAVLASLDLSPTELFLFKCLVAAGQEHVLGWGFEFAESEAEPARSPVKTAFYAIVEMIEKLDVSSDGSGKKKKKKVRFALNDEDFEDLKKLLKNLGEVEQFYNCIGGVIGYQITVMELLAKSRVEMQTTNWYDKIQEQMECQFLEIHAPSGLDLSENAEYAAQAALWGIQGLPDLGEIYPLGGSADRLGLVDPDTGECLPAAMLPYCGRTLLEGLIRDLQAREFLYFKIFGKQCITPVAIMTSAAKNNHEHITSLCEKLEWFKRGRSSFQLFEQPLVPAVSAEDGQWIIKKPFAPICKPGGHGVIWKLAYDKGIFQWFYDHGRKGATVRQVSNVVAATDLTLLALAGIGLHHGKKLGFASCKRNSGATEGINVLMEKKNLDGRWAYGLSCIEYTEFDKFGIADGPHSRNRLQAEFPANTNILYVDLPSAELVGSSKNTDSLPGMVLNVKKAISFVDNFGNPHSVPGGRLECTMQNIADNFLNTHPSRDYKGIEDKLDTFIVFNKRRRVTSSTKRKRRHADKSLHQTPDGSLLDILRNAHDLLSQCDIQLPEIGSNDKYLNSGPPFLILLHPALGPLWEVTRQKFCGGSICKGSELQVEVAEFLWRNVQLDGSLIIEADNVMGSSRVGEVGEPILQYGHRCGRCKLQNVRVLNEGIDWNFEDNVYWKHVVQRIQACKVVLHGNAEFEATDVILKGNHIFEVPNGYKMKITPGDSGLAIGLDPIAENMMDSGSWYWKYGIKDTNIQLELVEL
ncbi:putative UTP--glucose-1-phosphate uridylyltransferase [Rosa chinensis]|uniref:Putative UTP--glucose-1-phosphate uridylyltransferase n=1 Tax=Rosa chinensis TaxID=74649 RepID=A0A2P6SLC1_ROSCH|nr:UTP--glucose-1-phosphate uridylyltransferase 3, chloroplastic isoform X2 [Rosa chinensis]PRQ59485.1 putative UTP--glucose-1-phosphate uridylyltransferase [Rosa chinensis]